MTSKKKNLQVPRHSPPSAAAATAASTNQRGSKVPSASQCPHPSNKSFPATATNKNNKSQASHSSSSAAATTSTNQRGSKVPLQHPEKNLPSKSQQKQPPPPSTTSTTEKWATSKAKQYLEKELKDANSRFHKMSIDAIHAEIDCFRRFPLKNFKTNYKNLKTKIEATAARVEFDNKAVQEHKIKYPRQPTTKKGHPHWDTHPAKVDLENDVRDGTANIKAPMDLWITKKSYQQFPPDIFSKRVQAEKQKQRGASFWVEKRNRQGMKQRLSEVQEVK